MIFILMNIRLMGIATVCMMRQDVGVGAGLVISDFFLGLDDSAHRRVVNAQMIGNQLHRIAMLKICPLNCLISLRFISALAKQSR